MRVVFSTYQSLPVLAAALPEDFAFDLVVCDEAHRTTGVDNPNSDEVSAFRLIHDTEAVPAQFRLFMTATQRIYTAATKVKAEAKDSDIYSMDDEDAYGPLLYEMSFKDAVDSGLLSDYEVLIVATSQSRLTTGMSDLVAAVNNEGGRRQTVSTHAQTPRPDGPQPPQTARRAARSTRRAASPQDSCAFAIAHLLDQA